MSTLSQKMSKIDFYGLGEKVIKMMFGERPMTMNEISDKLKADGYDISPSTIRVFKDSVMNSTSEILLKKPKLREEYAEKYLDTLRNLLETMEDLNEKIEQYKDDEDWKAHATYMKEKLELISMLLKRAGEIKPMQVIKEMNVIEINQAIQIQLADLIDSGDIPLESCSERIKKIYINAKKMKA